ncbi:hypothetical protein ACHAQH_003604 [Verticillium albo-atrum]
MDHSFDKTQHEQESAFIDYLFDDPEQLTSNQALAQSSANNSGRVVDHLQGVGTRPSRPHSHGGGDHTRPAGHRTTSTSAHPPPHLPSAPLIQDRQTQHEQAIPGSLFYGPQLQWPDFGGGLHINTPSTAQTQSEWSFTDNGTFSLTLPPAATEATLRHVDPTSVIDFGLGATNPDEYASNITPLRALSITRPTFDFDFDFHSPSWSPSLDDAVSSSLVVGTGTTSHPRSAMNDESDNKDQDPFWADEDSSSLGGGGRPSAAACKRVDKGKRRADSLDGTSSSVFSTGTDDTGPHPDLSPRPRPRPRPGSGSGSGPGPKTEFPKPASRRSSRPTRAKSVATTASASSTKAKTLFENVKPATDSATAARLRSASRASKNAARRPSESAEERRTRASHNLVEKQYRSRLNAQFEGLLSALPELPAAQQQQPQQQQQQQQALTAIGAVAAAEEQGERRVSKAEVLERARLHIETLERERETLRLEREELLRNLAEMERGASVRMGESVSGANMRESPASEEDERQEQAEREK